MRFAKVIGSGILVWAIVVGLCGVSFSRETVTFTHWTFTEASLQSFWEMVIPEFEKQYPDIKAVKHEIPRKLYWNKIKVLASVGPAPDVIGTIPVMLQQWIAMEAVEPLEPLMDLTEIKRTFIPQQRTFCMKDGKTYAVIQGARPLVLVYNEKLLEEAGIAVPTFPPELVAAATKLTQPEKGQYGIGLKIDEAAYSDTYDGLANFPLGYGADFAKNGVPTATDPNTILGVKLFKLLADLGVTPIAQDEKVTGEQLYRGRVAMLIGGPWHFGRAEAVNPEMAEHLNAAMTPFANKAATGGAHHFLVVPALAKNKSGGAKFIKFMASEKYESLYNEAVGMIPGNLAWASKTLLKDTKWFKAFVEGLNYATIAIPEGFASVAPEFSRIVVEHVVGDIVLKNEPVEETMEKLQRALEELAKEL